MQIPAESLSATSVRDKVVTATEAVRLIRDGESVVVEGFVGQGFAEELTLALEERFLQTGTPSGLTLVFTVAQGNRQGRGLDRLCHEDLLKRALGGHWSLAAELGKMAVENKIEAHNLPRGVISQLFRDTAAGKPGLLTRVGLGSFVDPRYGGGKINRRTTQDRVELITLDGEEYLFYQSLQLDVAFLRGTTADPEGNITMEREALTFEALAVATAVHNAGGLVIVHGPTAGHSAGEVTSRRVRCLNAADGREASLKCMPPTVFCAQAAAGTAGSKLSRLQLRAKLRAGSRSVTPFSRRTSRGPVNGTPKPSCATH